MYGIDRADVVRDHLDLILKFVRPTDGLVPRYLDSTDTTWRYIDLLFRRRPRITDRIKANYTGGGNQGQVIDSNVLVLLVALDYVNRTGDLSWWQANESKLVQVYRHYDRFRDSDGLIVQGGGSDWQDSVRKRSGKTFYTNVLYYAATERLAIFPAFGIRWDEPSRLRQGIHRIFFPDPMVLPLAQEGQPQVGLDGILLAFDYDFFRPGSAEAERIYRLLGRHPLWTKNNGIPGYNTYPDYPSGWIDFKPKLSGLGHYHDSIYWSWLMGLSAKLAYRMGDFTTGDRVLSLLESLAIRDGNVSEIYRNEPPFKRFVNFVYRSEAPFSWGIGMTLDAIETQKSVEWRKGYVEGPEPSVLDYPFEVWR